MRQLVINADDFGICVETNAAVEMACRAGGLTSASLMCNMPAFDDAVAVARRNPGLGIGVHLVLTSGAPVARPAEVPMLVDGAGRFRHGFASLCRMLAGPARRAALEQIRRELIAQAERARRAGLRLDHVDSHRHVHVIPALWPLVHSLAAEYGCASVRVPAESGVWRRACRPASLPRVLKAVVLRGCVRLNQSARHQGVFAGVLDSGRMTAPALGRLLQRIPAGVSEIVTHPSLFPAALPAAGAPWCARLDLAFLRSPRRQAELAALLDPRVRRVIAERGIRLVTFGAAAETPPHQAVASLAC